MVKMENESYRNDNISVNKNGKMEIETSIEFMEESVALSLIRALYEKGLVSEEEYKRVKKYSQERVVNKQGK